MTNIEIKINGLIQCKNNPIKYDEVVSVIYPNILNHDYSGPYYKVEYRKGPSNNPTGEMQRFSKVSIQSNMEFEVINPRSGMTANELIDMLHILGTEGGIPCRVWFESLNHGSTRSGITLKNKKSISANSNEFVVSCKNNKIIIDTGKLIPNNKRTSLEKDITTAIDSGQNCSPKSEVCVNTPEGRIYGATILYDSGDHKDDLILLY